MFTYPGPRVYDDNNKSSAIEAQNSAFTIVVLPDYVERALRAGLGATTDLLDYQRVRRVVNTYDFGLWAAIAEQCSIVFKGRDYRIGNGIGQLYSNVEFNNVVMPVVHASEDVRLSAKAFLEQTVVEQGQSAYPSALPTDTDPRFFYQFKSIGATIFLIVQPGFLTQLKRSTSLVEFLRDWIKELEKVVPLNKIATEPLFQVYLNCLRQEITAA